MSHCIIGDCLEVLQTLGDESVHCCVTSPPYWGLRDYGTAKWEGGDPKCAHRGSVQRTAPAGTEKQASNHGAVASGDCACGSPDMGTVRGLLLTIVRPATVCGVSPRMRLDVVVNMLASQALATGRMTAHCGEHGGELMRPNVHIEDVTALYCWLIEHPEVTGTFNAGFENLSVGDTARLIAQKIPAEISLTKVPDKRSYRVSSEKLLAAGFRPQHSVADAVSDIARAWHERRIKIADRCYNLLWMRKHGLVEEPPKPQRVRG